VAFERKMALSDDEFFIRGSFIGSPSQRNPLETYDQVPPDVPTWGQAYKDYLTENLNRYMGLQLLTEPLPYEHSRIDLDPNYRDVYGVPGARVTRRIGENERRMGRFIHARAVEILQAAGVDASGVRRGRGDPDHDPRHGRPAGWATTRRPRSPTATARCGRAERVRRRRRGLPDDGGQEPDADDLDALVLARRTPSSKGASTWRTRRTSDEPMTTPPPTPPAPPPDVRRTLAWRGWGTACAEAARAGACPIVCLAEPGWSNGAQRLALVLAQDDETRRLLEDDFVPILVDPDGAARRRRPPALGGGVATGTAGPPAGRAPDPAGRPSSPTAACGPRARAPYPSLGSLLRSVADLARARPADLEADAAALPRARRRTGTEVWRRPYWTSIGGASTRSSAACASSQAAARAPPVAAARDARPRRRRRGRRRGAAGDAATAAAADHVQRTLDGMRRGGVLDQLGGSFHRCGRDERWVVPHFEKLVPVNAALAAVYARAAARFGRADFAATAEGAAAFALAGLDEGTMVVAADAGYYTWTPRSVHELLDAAQVQAVGLHVNLTRDDTPHVLFRAREPEDMGTIADEPVEVLRRRLDGGLHRMALDRMQRPLPALADVPAPAWYATTVRWLYAAERFGASLEAERLATHLDGLLDGPFDDGRGFARAGRYWLEDQVAIGAACLAATDRTPDRLATAERVADLLLGAYVDPRTGALRDTPGDERPESTPDEGRVSFDVVDVDVAASVPAAIELLRALAARTSAERYAVAADAIARGHAGALTAVAPTHEAPSVGTSGATPARAAPARAAAPTAPTTEPGADVPRHPLPTPARV
jgi:hypothetical protein